MKLQVISTGSIGNCYLLGNEQEAILLECGVSIDKIKKALNFNFEKVKGCLLTHEHGDHCKSIQGVTDLGINVYSSRGTFKGLKKQYITNRQKTVEAGATFQIGNFKVIAFDVKHDANEPFGYLIQHQDCGKVLFLTDTYFCEYTFKGLNNVIIEANYSKEIINKKYGADSDKEFLRNRVLKSHFSLENCMDMLSANDLTNVNNIVLIHLSDTNSNEREFKKQVEKLTGKTVTVASANMVIPFSKTPF